MSATRLLRTLIGCGVSFATAAAPLVGTVVFFRGADPFDSMIMYVVWWAILGLLMGWLATRDPAHTWRWVARVELGFLSGVAFAIAVAVLAGEPMNLWPLTLLWSFIVSTPVVILSGLLGRQHRTVPEQARLSVSQSDARRRGRS